MENETCLKRFETGGKQKGTRLKRFETGGKLLRARPIFRSARSQAPAVTPAVQYPPRSSVSRDKPP